MLTYFHTHIIQGSNFSAHGRISAPRGADGGHWDKYKFIEKFICVCGGGAILGTTWTTEMVLLSKFAEFCEDLNGNTFNTVTQLQKIANIKIMIFKCTFKEGQYLSAGSFPLVLGVNAFILIV